MTVIRAFPLARCCGTHDDWHILAAHLLLDFDVPARAVALELERARSAVEHFELDEADALACAELIVRSRFDTSARHDW